MTETLRVFEFVFGIYLRYGLFFACEWLFRFPDRSIGPVEKFHAAVIENLPDPVRLRPVLAGPCLVAKVNVFFDLFGRDRDLGVGETALLKPFRGIAKKNAEGPAHVFEGG